MPDLKPLAKKAPLEPGVYIFKNEEGLVIYVGKASVLRSRLLSYFRGTQKHESKTRAMLSHAHHLEWILLGNEQEALIKENELIKKHQPHYNIMLRDDKSYPWVKVTIGDHFPRIYFTRILKQDGALYYGPYPKVNNAKMIIQHIIETCKIRDCKDKIKEGVESPACLSLQIGKCDGPCLDLLTAKEYGQGVKRACAFLDGQQKEILRILKKEMNEASKEMNFEKAAEKRDMIAAANTLAKGHVIKRTVDFEKILLGLQKVLKLKTVPQHIECFDISNISGTYSVASMVVFRKGKPSKKDYRKFKIKTVEGIDDFSMMKEVVERRYQRLLKKGKSFPDLIMVDGGKGQLNAAAEILRELGVVQDLIGLAKRFELIFKVGVKDPVILSKYSEELQLLQRVRDESHRFAVTFHRQLRQGHTLKSELLEISGVGPVLVRRILARFGSVAGVKKVRSEDLEKVKGISEALAKVIVNFYKIKYNRI